MGLLLDTYKGEYKNANTAKEIYTIMSYFRRLAYYKDYGGIDYILRNLILDNMSPTAMVCVVRSTYSSRHNLESWLDVLLKVRSLLDDGDNDVDKILRGLYENK